MGYDDYGSGIFGGGGFSKGCCGGGRGSRDGGDFGGERGRGGGDKGMPNAACPAYACYIFNRALHPIP